MTRHLPAIFDRVVVFLAVQAHVVAAIAVVRSAGAYRSAAACWALVILSLVVPLAGVLTARRRGGLSARAFLSAAAVLIAVDLAQLAVMRTDDYGDPAVWTWGTIGVTTLTFAAYRPARDVLALAG